MHINPEWLKAVASEIAEKSAAIRVLRKFLNPIAMTVASGDGQSYEGSEL